MELVQDELHGPVLCVIRVEDYNEYIETANLLPHGKGSIIFTEDDDVFNHVVNRLQAGFVSKNRRVVEARQCREGWRASGKGQLFGKEVFREYSALKGFKIRPA